ncbi:MAG: hypothetical protein ACI9Y1_001145 [Lentisphaeria bacterium]|jgi:hypothetical protein
MEKNARLYNCTRCHSIVFICRQCDRGNVYCDGGWPIASAAARRTASSRYQKTFEGRLKHAARQRRYRERLREKVTHMGSLHNLLHDLLSSGMKKQKTITSSVASINTTTIICSSCSAGCSPFLRRNFLRSLC